MILHFSHFFFFFFFAHAKSSIAVRPGLDIHVYMISYMLGFAAVLTVGTVISVAYYAFR